MDAKKSLTKSDRIKAKIAAYEQQLDEIQKEERKQLKTESQKEIGRLFKRSGLLALVRSGKVTLDQLENEFRSLADRTRGTAPKVDEQSLHTEEPVGTGEPETKKSGFWSR